MNDCIHKNACRICGQPDFIKILDLGEMPPANAYLKKEELDAPEEKFPLIVYFCNNCGLLQLLDVVSPLVLFRNYHYLTSASKPLADHFEKMARELADTFVTSKEDLILEIGGNDGTLLSAVRDTCRVLNVEPAENVAEISRQRGVPAISDSFGFNQKFAEGILKDYGRAKVVVANNVVAHIDNLKDMFEGVKMLIGRDGVFVFEVHWVGNLIGDGGFDQIYHEHLSYFSLTALDYLINQLGLKIFDVKLVPIHGESLRVYVSANREQEKSVDEFLAREKELGLDRLESYENFAKKVEKNKRDLKDMLIRIKAEGKKIIGYGAPAKGNTLLNYFGIGSDILEFITDTTSFKQGLYSPGMRVPIHHPDKIKEFPPDYILLLAWNYARAILEKEKELREQGVKFIIPVPEVKIV